MGPGTGQCGHRQSDLSAEHWALSASVKPIIFYWPSILQGNKRKVKYEDEIEKEDEFSTVPLLTGLKGKKTNKHDYVMENRLEIDGLKEKYKTEIKRR